MIALVGDIGEEFPSLYDAGLAAVFSINLRAVPLHEARRTCREDLTATAESVMRLLSAWG